MLLQATVQDLISGLCKSNTIFLGQQTWDKLYPDCAGKFQSPVDLPVTGLIKVHGQRPLVFCNYAEVPLSMTMYFDGNRCEYNHTTKLTNIIKYLLRSWRKENRVYSYVFYCSRELYLTSKRLQLMFYDNIMFKGFTQKNIDTRVVSNIS